MLRILTEMFISEKKCNRNGLRCSIRNAYLLAMLLRRFPRGFVLLIACLFGVLVTLAATAQSIGKLNQLSAASAISVSLEQAGQDAPSGQDGSCTVDDQCLDDILVESSAFLNWHVRASSVAPAMDPVVDDGPFGLISPPPNA